MPHRELPSLAWDTVRQTQLPRADVLFQDRLCILLRVLVADLEFHTGNKRVFKAISAILSTGIPYLASTFWACEVVEELCKKLIDGTGGKMARVYLTGSGQCSASLHIKVLMNVSRI